MDSKTGVLMERYELGRFLGQGTFAKVHFARSIITGQSVAIKIIDKDKVSRVGLVDQIKREISVMRLVSHPNIVQLHEVMATTTKIYFVLEYAKGGELFDKVANGKLKEDVARRYFRQLINAIDFCHSRGVFHRDLKPENLLLDENEDLKISDFGLCALMKSKRHDGLLHTSCGTPAYVAPEVISRKGYDGIKADTWSCGVILYVLLSGCLPFHDSNLMELYRKIGRAQYKCPSWFAPEVRKLLAKILDPNPHTRISIAKIKESPWFRRGSISKSIRSSAEIKQVVSPNTDQPDSLQNCITTAEDGEDLERVASLNAFDIILFSPGFDLNRLFEEENVQREARFTSWQSPSAIISKLEEIAKRLKVKLRKTEAGVLRFEGFKEGRKGVLSIDAKIFQITPKLHLVEVHKSSGDTLDYEKVFDEEIRPELHDIEFSWQGESQQTSQQLSEQRLENLRQQQQQLTEYQKLHAVDEQQQLLQELVIQDKLPSQELVIQDKLPSQDKFPSQELVIQDKLPSQELVIQDKLP